MSQFGIEIVLDFVWLGVMLFSGYMLYWRYKDFKEIETKEERTASVFYTLLTGTTLSMIGFFFGSLFLFLIFTLDIIRTLLCYWAADSSIRVIGSFLIYLSLGK